MGTCVGDLFKNKQVTEDKTYTKTKKERKSDSLKRDVKTLDDQIAELNAQVDDLNAQIKRAGEDRQAQNAEFKRVTEDQDKTQLLLSDALKFLKDSYAGALLQQQQQHQQ